MPFQAANSLKNYPFVKLVVALTAGIILQWYFNPSLKITLWGVAFILCLLVCFSFLSSAKKFNLNWLRGCFVLVLFVCAGMLLTSRQNIQHNALWFGNVYKPGNIVSVTLEEPLIEKANSYKALASVNAVLINTEWHLTKGNILLYFKKDSSIPALHYGSQVIFKRSLQAITNSGNPASLDYKRYCLFGGITSQVLLSNNDYIISTSTHKNFLKQFLF